MKKVITILCLFITTVSFSQTIWLFDNASGLGDGTSWNDANNWTDKDGVLPSAVPSAGDEARLIINNSTITGTVTDFPGNITIGGSKTVTLDLDITIGDGTGTLHGIVMYNNAVLNIASTRTVTIKVPVNKEAIRLNAGKTNTINVAGGATINIQQCLNGILSEDATHNINNSGTINITGATSSGILLTNGTITNDGTIDISSNTNIGLNYDAGTFTNNGTLNITNALTECLTIAAANFSNTGTMSLTSAGTLSAHNCIDIETGGTLTNSGTITADGSSDVDVRTISVVGTLSNSGTITFSGGNQSRSLSNDGGTITNEVCGLFDLTDRRMNNNAGTYVNNGLMKSTHPTQGMFAPTTATNNGFYNFANGGWTGTDNGIDVSSGNFTVDALSSCAVTDIGIDAAYTWYKEAANSTQAGTNDGVGTLTLDNDVWSGEAAGTKTVYSCFGSEFTMTINNVDGGCLPVELMYFEGEKVDASVILSWETASELNNAGFEIQRSNNGTQWEVVGFVEGHGTTFEHQFYRFVDEHPTTTNYYRLKQIDFNDAFDFSNVIHVEMDNVLKSNHALIYPNPTRGTFNIEVEIHNNAHLNLYNNVGQLIKTYQLNNQNTSISLDEFEKGLYHIQIINGTLVQNTMIIKQ